MSQVTDTGLIFLFFKIVKMKRSNPRSFSILPFKYFEKLWFIMNELTNYMIKIMKNHTKNTKKTWTLVKICYVSPWYTHTMLLHDVHVCFCCTWECKHEGNGVWKFFDSARTLPVLWPYLSNTYPKHRFSLKLWVSHSNSQS